MYFWDISSMEKLRAYIDLNSEAISLTELVPEEVALIERLQERATTHPNWNTFENYWTETVLRFYGSRPRDELSKTAGYRVGKDLAARLAIAAGRARIPDYRDELAEIIRLHFRTRREFCELTGLSETMLSQVLGGKKHLSMEALIQSLEKLGYRLRIVARQEIETPRSSKEPSPSAAPKRVMVDLAKCKLLDSRRNGGTAERGRDAGDEERSYDQGPSHSSQRP
jgi:hypothetical protein